MRATRTQGEKKVTGVSKVRVRSLIEGQLGDTDWARNMAMALSVAGTNGGELVGGVVGPWPVRLTGRQLTQG
jgi:hypothetical protein